MGQGSINQYQAPRAAIEGILAALQAAHTFYGIKGASQASALLSKQSDPNSQESKAAQAEANLGLDYAVKHHYVDEKSISALRNLTMGTEAKGNSGDADYQPGTPGLSAAALAKNPEISPFYGLIKGQQSADAMGNKFNSINDTKKQMQDNTIHSQVLGKLDTNKALTARLTQYQNLDNAYSNLLGTGPVTAQKIQDFQQGIIKNLGISGSSGVGERGERYYNSLDLKAGAGLQFLTGNPVDLASSKFLPGLIDQAKTEQQNISGQMNKQIGALTSGHGSMYDRRPDLKADLDQAVAAHISQFAATSGGPQSAPSEGSLGGSPFPGSNAQAAEADPKIVDYAKQHGLDYGTATHIINQRQNAKSR